MSEVCRNFPCRFPERPKPSCKCNEQSLSSHCLLSFRNLKRCMARPWKIPSLDPHDRMRVCAGKILKTRCREMLSYESGIIDDTDIEALHDMRVSSRRLQVSLKIFHSCFPQKKYVRCSNEIKNIVRSLGIVREHDVLLTTLLESKKNLAARDMRAIDLLIARQRNIRSIKHKRLLQRLKSLRDEKFESNFREFLNTAAGKNS